jgi:hypothetical protein
LRHLFFCFGKKFRDRIGGLSRKIVAIADTSVPYRTPVKVAFLPPNRQKSHLNRGNRGAYVYFLQSPDLSSAYALASAWVVAIIILERVMYPKRETEGSLVYQNLRDVYKDYAGKGVLRSFSTTEVNGFKVPTIELKKDDRGNRHETPYFQHVTEVKFGFYKRDKDPKECVYTETG